MLKSIIALLLSAGCCYGSPLILTDPIPISGQGAWSIDYFDSIHSQSAHAFGTDGVNTVSFSYDSYCSASAASINFSNLSATCDSGQASIDGISVTISPFSPFVTDRTNGSFAIYGNSLTLFDLAGTELASAALGYSIEILTDIRGTGFWFSEDGTYRVNPAIPVNTAIVASNPEPSSWLMLGTGLLLIGRKAARAPRGRV